MPAGARRALAAGTDRLLAALHASGDPPGQHPAEGHARPVFAAARHSGVQPGLAPSEERAGQIERYLAEQVAAVMGFPIGRVERSVPLTGLGIDSLMAVELRNRVERDLGVRLSVVELLQGPSIAALARSLDVRLAIPAHPASGEHDQHGDTKARRGREEREQSDRSGREDEETDWEEGSI